MKTRVRTLTREERQGDLEGVLAVVEPLWEGDELDYFQWAREGGQRVQIPTELLSGERQGARAYGPLPVLALRAKQETVVNPFLIKIFLYQEGEDLAREAAQRFEQAIGAAYHEREGADF